MSFLTPAEITEATIQTGVKKSKLPIIHILLLGFLSGAFTAFASGGSNMAAFNLLANPETYGLGRCLAGAIFGTGLMISMIAGGELFPGNTLMCAALFQRKITFMEMLRNWVCVYIGNLLGSLLIAFMMNQSGLFASSANLLGAMTIKIAVTKVELPFHSAFFLGIMCNWLICLAVYMACGATDITGKILAIFFPIWLFVTSGFENSIANMYYIPAGIMAKSNEVLVQAVTSIGVSSESLSQLSWNSFFVNNLIPVTLGNIVGGGMFVAGIYWFVYANKNAKNNTENCYLSEN